MELGINNYNRPTYCSKCGGLMIFAGVGEYHCEDCRSIEYDDYGKVRLYIETNRGATAAKIEAEIGVSQKAIRQMVRESRLEIAADSKTFYKCEVCGTSIRTGSLCPACEKKYHKQIEDKEREKRAKLMGKGIGMSSDNHESGEKRFRRKL